VSSAETAAPARPPRFGRFFWRDPNTQFLLLAAAAGICGGLGAIAFRFVTRYLTRLLLGSEDVVRGGEMVEPWLRVVIPAAGGLAGGLVARFFFGEKGPSGISHLIEVVSIGRRTVRVRPSLARGVSSILVISSELPEVISLSDRIVVLRGGRVAGELPRREATEDSVLRLMAGIGSPGALTNAS